MIITVIFLEDKFMELLMSINEVYEILKRNDNIEIHAYEIEEVISNQNLEQIEEDIEFKFPEILRRFYVEEASEVRFNWSTAKERQNEYCKYGGINIISPKKTAEEYNDMMSMVEEVYDWEEFEYSDGLKAIVEDWPNWIPVVKFYNGDMFCVDKRSSSGEVVFFDHEVVEGDMGLHGLKIAENFSDLIMKWKEIGFVDIYDWTDGVDERGIDLSKEVFNGGKNIMFIGT